jgi:hypothetical protein
MDERLAHRRCASRSAFRERELLGWGVERIALAQRTQAPLVAEQEGLAGFTATACGTCRGSGRREARPAPCESVQ